ncbi:glycosyltransferase family 4 protein [Corallibacter sp.]|uniref:glycosyltransferase family 4 protein n=1 Tax=Corallibacter sp. TaxID=2038084 RepID=UPI003AB8F304
MKQQIGLVLSKVPGYSETFFRNKILGLQKAGYKVVLIVTNPEKNNTKVLNCDVIVAPSFKGAYWRVIIQVLLALFKITFLFPKRAWTHYQLDKKSGQTNKQAFKRLLQNAYIMHLNLDWLHFGFGMLAVGREHVAKTIQAQMAVSFRGFDLYLSPLKHPGCYALLFTMKSVKYHVLSNEMRTDLSSYGVSVKKIHIITPAIDVQFFKPQPLQTAPFDKQPIRIVTVARLHWKKGLEYTLEALALLKKQGVLFHYTIIGSGEDYERLMFATHQFQLHDNVTFAGRLNPKQVRAKLNESNIYLQYSIQEGFCNAVLEAQAMGLLCIVSDAEGLAENIIHRKTGWVVPKRQPKSLAKTINMVNNLTPEERLSVSKQAMNRVQNTFTLEQQQQQFLKFYNK